MKKNDKKGKLIRFPVEKVKKASPEESAKERARWMKENSKLFYSVALTATIFMAASANDLFSLNQKELGSREIASVSGRSPDSTGPSITRRNPDFERQVARRLASMNPREVASVGYRPSEEEEIRFGLLEGKYGLEYFEDGGLKGVHLAGNHNAQLAPTYMPENRIAFIKKVRPLLAMDFDRVESRSVERQSSKIIETYDLIGDNNEVLAEVQLGMDEPGRLHSMKVKLLNQN